MLESSRNHPPTPPQSVEKLSSTKPVPGAKKVRERCIREPRLMEGQLSSRRMVPSVDTVMMVVMVIMMIRTLIYTEHQVGAKHCAEYIIYT